MSQATSRFSVACEGVEWGVQRAATVAPTPLAPGMAAPGHGAHDGMGDASKMPDLATLQNLQSMDWLLKKERIFLLAQFWQQVSGLNGFF